MYRMLGIFVQVIIRIRRGIEMILIGENTYVEKSHIVKIKIIDDVIAIYLVDNLHEILDTEVLTLEDLLYMMESG